MEKSTVVIHSEICEKCGEATIIRKIWDSGSHTIKFLCACQIRKVGPMKGLNTPFEHPRRRRGEIN